MNKEAFIEQGAALVKELHQRAADFHAKSSQHEELFWEATGVETRLKLLEAGDEESLKKEPKAITMGVGLLNHSPEQAKRVITFYKELKSYHGA